jgi:putative FmdB family regulatory protein
MPTYDYECQACKHTFEKFQSITAGPIRKCPRCGRLKVKRLLGTGAGVIFKGSGFYSTDYRDSSYKNDAKKDKPAESCPKTDTKKTCSQSCPNAKKE